MVASPVAQSSDASASKANFDALSRDERIETNLPLVHFAVRRLAGICAAANVDKEDAFSYGVEGLIKAVDNFDATRGASFSSYALLRIRGSILDAARNQDALSRPLRKKVSDLETASNELAHKLGRWPTTKEIAFYTGHSINEVQSTMAHRGARIVSLETPQDGSWEGSFTLDVEDHDENVDPAEVTDRAEMLKLLQSALHSLPARDRQIVEMRYQRAMSFQNIAALLSLSESRVCQIHKRVLTALGRRMKADLSAA